MSTAKDHYAAAQAVFAHLVDVASCPHEKDSTGEYVDMVTVDDLCAALYALDESRSAG